MKGGNGKASLSGYNTGVEIKYPISGGGGATDISLDWGSWTRKSNQVDFEVEPDNWYDWKSDKHLHLQPTRGFFPSSTRTSAGQCSRRLSLQTQAIPT